METKAYKNIIYDKKPPIAYIIFNRPEKMNAFNMELQVEVDDALENAGWNDDEIRVIVIKGTGRCFSAGFDISPRPTTGSIYNNTVNMRNRMLKSKGFHSITFWDLTWKNPKPIIAQVHGFCLAAGLGVAAMCDLCICSEDALFGYPRIRDGGPYIAGVQPWLLGMRKAKEFLFTGNMFDAQEAYRLGYVNKVVPRDKLDEAVNSMARTISKVPAIANEYSKVLVNMSYDMMNIRTVLERGSELEAICLTADAESAPEVAEFKRIQQEKGIKAALEWRNSNFTEEDAWWKKQRQQKK